MIILLFYFTNHYNVPIMKFNPHKINIYLSAMFLINLLAISMLYTNNNKLKIAQKKQNEYIKIFYENTKTKHGLYAVSPIVGDTIDFYKNMEFVTVCRIKRNQCNSCIRTSLSIMARLSADDSSHNYFVVSSEFPNTFIIDKLKNIGANLDKIYFRNYYVQELEVAICHISLK